ncbi:unnamed protein product [Linum tenue]|uniref:Uncharacterized protein n=1 Tax=Linum tenue TaxID=586396 RepID=A0AAV0QKD7_9ROSI|nr:unnamed protein product [Linum tenue]
MVRDHVKRNFPRWMYGLRDQIFKKYKDLNQRMNHPPPQISPSIWREMLQKWTNPNWVNIGNREKSELAATGGSALLAKYRHEEDGTIQAEAEKVSQGEEPNKFAIYQEVIGPQRPKRVIGMGHGRLGVRLPESFDMDLNSEANGEQGRVGETHGNDVANDESDEETAEETTADA